MRTRRREDHVMLHDPGEDSRTMSLWSLPISCHCPQDFHHSLTGCASCGWLIVTLKWKTFFNLWCPKVRILSSQFQILATSSYSKLCLFKLIALINYFRHEEDCVSQCSRYHSIWQGITGGKLGTILAISPPRATDELSIGSNKPQDLLGL